MADLSPERKELKANWKAETTVPELSLTDVGKHKSASDLWIVVHNKVYNVTEYARDHPGGADALREVGGTDATSAYETVGHSEDAREILHSFLVGVVQGTSAEDTSTKKEEVQIVRRRSEATTTPKQDTSSAQMRLELATFATTTIAAVYSTRHLNLVAPSCAPSTGSFFQGFVLAATTRAAVGLVGYRQLAKAVSGRIEVTAYPAHMHGKVVTSALTDTHRPAGFLRPTDYQSLVLTKKEELAKDIYRFVFALPAKDMVLGLPIGQHIVIRGEVGDHIVTRSYTPVSNNWDLGRLELGIRCYPDGQLTGGYLLNLQVGDSAEFRGPKGAMRYRKEMAKELGMIAGGTGITPMYQLIRAICDDKTDNTVVSLIYANRSEADILMKKQLDKYARDSSNKLSIHYVLDKPPSEWKGGRGYVNKDMMQERLCKARSDTKVMLCGPPGMVNASKKTLIELGFEAPGAVSKLADQIFCF